MSDSSGKSKQRAPIFALEVQYLKALSFDNVGAPGSFRGEENFHTQGSNNEIKIDVQTAPINDDNEHYEVQTLIEIISKAKKESVRFKVRVSYAAVVLARNIPKSDLDLLLNVETPRMTFPYLRQVISHATCEAGYPALNLAPIDFTEVYRQRQRQLAEQTKDKKES